MYFLDLWNTFLEFLQKDTQSANESKKTAVVIRILTLSFVVYLLIPTISGNVVSAKGGLFIYLTVLLLNGVVFAATYRYEAFWVFIGFSISMVLWIISFISYFGWNVGVQHFIMVLLVLVFYAQYNNVKFKVSYAAGLCVLRILLYHIFFESEALAEIGKRDNNSLQIINTIVIFWCISVVAYIYGKDSQELEGKLIDYNRELELLANTDKLTSLYNRRKAMEYIEECCNTCGDKGFCLCICDIDFFKKVNDTYGHDMGDKVLVALSNIFREEMTDNYLAARWGGEEFLLLFPNTNGDEAFVKLCEIRRKIKDLVVKQDDVKVKITMTFGLAEYDYSGSYKAMLTNADKKLYRGKEGGRDRIVY